MPAIPLDRKVLERARRGDERAFEAVVTACGGLVLSLAWRMVRDRQEAEDLSQEVFLRLWRVLPRYDPSHPFEPWLRKVAVNLLLNLTSGKARRLRKRTASLEALGGAEASLPRDREAAGAEVEAVRKERAALLREAVLELRPDHRVILALRYFRGLTYEELARDLSLPLGTVKNRLFRAREELAGLLGGRLP